MAHKQLKEAVHAANFEIVDAELVLLTWGNVSAVDREAGVLAIKPSGVDYDALRPADFVLVSLETGQPLEGQKLRPSSDTPTHLHLYREFPEIAAVVHTHSPAATSYAQAHRPIPCLGTTHADHFYGEVPLTRPLNDSEIAEAYEHNTGVVIVERFRKENLDPLQRPGVLVAAHGPFAWGDTLIHAVENAIVLERVAQMATQTFLLSPEQPPIPQTLLDKHFLRKHGKDAYYGQK